MIANIALIVCASHLRIVSFRCDAHPARYCRYCFDCWDGGGANVLIYERIREELRSGAASKLAIQVGYDKALSTIIDANLTTLPRSPLFYLVLEVERSKALR